MTLIVKELALFFRFLLVCELTPTNCVAHCDDARLNYHSTRLKYESLPGFDHDLVNNARISFNFQRAVLLYLNESRENIFTGNTHLIEAQPAIVSCVITKFCAQVANLDARERFVILKTSDRYNERLYTIIFSINNKPSVDNSMSCLEA